MVFTVALFLLFMIIMFNAETTQFNEAFENDATMEGMVPFMNSLGKDGEAVALEIRTAFPNLNVHVVKHNAFITMDFSLDRVRVIVDEAGKVVSVPRKG
jgi:hypothetical protein